MHPNRKRIEKREESSADRWARKAKEQARQNKIHEAIDDDVGIDFPSMPSFETFEEGNAWLLERIGEWYVRKCGHWELFQNSQRLPGFKEAEASWKRASGEFLRREGYGGVASGPVNLDEIFFYRVGRDPSGALVDCHQVVAEAAQRGDVNFFLRIPSSCKSSLKRGHLLRNVRFRRERGDDFLLRDERFGVADNVDEQDMADLKPDLFFRFSGHLGN